MSITTTATQQQTQSGLDTTRNKLNDYMYSKGITQNGFNTLPNEINNLIHSFVRPRITAEIQKHYKEQVKEKYKKNVNDRWDDFYNFKYKTMWNAPPIELYREFQENFISYEILHNHKYRIPYNAYESIKEFFVFQQYANPTSDIFNKQNIFYSGLKKIARETISIDYEGNEEYEILPPYVLRDETFITANENRENKFIVNYHNVIKKDLTLKYGYIYQHFGAFNYNDVIGKIHISSPPQSEEEKKIYDDYNSGKLIKYLQDTHGTQIYNIDCENGTIKLFFSAFARSEYIIFFTHKNKKKYNEVIKQMVNNFYKPNKRHLITFEKKLCKFENEKKLTNRDITFLRKPYLMENIFNEMKKNNTHGVGGGWVRRVNPLREYLGLETLKE